MSEPIKGLLAFWIVWVATLIPQISFADGLSTELSPGLSTGQATEQATELKDSQLHYLLGQSAYLDKNYPVCADQFFQALDVGGLRESGQALSCLLSI